LSVTTEDSSVLDFALVSPQGSETPDVQGLKTKLPEEAPAATVTYAAKAQIVLRHVVLALLHEKAGATARIRASAASDARVDKHDASEVRGHG
jgi:hypothetical protein